MISTPRLEPFLQAFRDGRKLVVLTAYDVWQAELAEAGGADLLLVGDSLGMVEQGRDSTAGVTLEHVMYHTRMAARGRRHIPIVADLPLHPAFGESWARLRTTSHVPDHDCGLELPHTVVGEDVFAWCMPGAMSRPASAPR